ncbi:hypothetical protein [Caulobacter sp.]|uniref:hypothetical protein n=1 Tax=Caulobacter sp. TaxID=78 RepID=UPI00161C793A
MTPVVKLRERRLDMARQAAAQAQEAVATAAGLLARAEAAVLHAGDEARQLDAWFAEQLTGSAAVVQAGLARRETLAAAKVQAIRDRDAAHDTLDAARAILAEAVALVMRAEGRCDAMRDQLSGARAQRLLDREEREQLELEDLTRRRAW